MPTKSKRKVTAKKSPAKKSQALKVRAKSTPKSTPKKPKTTAKPTVSKPVLNLGIRRAAATKARSERSVKAARTRKERALKEEKYGSALPLCAPLVIGVVIKDGLVEKFVTNDSVIVARMPRMYVIENDSNGMEGGQYQFEGERFCVSDTAALVPSDELLSLNRRFKDQGPDFPVEVGEKEAHDAVHSAEPPVVVKKIVSGILEQHGAAVGEVLRLSDEVAVHDERSATLSLDPAELLRTRQEESFSSESGFNNG